jgi:hypothetical protein
MSLTREGDLPQGIKEERVMSALGQRQTCAAPQLKSALCLIADICHRGADFRFVPGADIPPGCIEG